jgi:hypothetical protein
MSLSLLRPDSAPARQPPGCPRARAKRSGGTGTRPGGGMSGPFRAALKTYRKFEQDPAADRELHVFPTTTRTSEDVP